MGGLLRTIADSITTGLVLVAAAAWPFSSAPAQSIIQTSDLNSNVSLGQDQPFNSVTAARSADSTTPDIQARSALVIDTSDSLVLWSRNETEELPIASLTKLMTAIVALDRLAPNQVATVSASDIGSPEESQMGLQAGDRVTVSELIRGLLIASGNDAANTLAHASGSWADFVSQMNDKATALGLTHTHFANPSGLDSEGHYSTVRDLAFLAEYALRYPLIRQSVGTAHYTAHSLSGKVFNLTTTNLLLDQGKVIGIKTGHTAAAGWCLIGLEPLHGREIMSVVLNSPDRFGETTNLFSWVDGHVK